MMTKREYKEHFVVSTIEQVRDLCLVSENIKLFIKIPFKYSKNLLSMANNLIFSVLKAYIVRPTPAWLQTAAEMIATATYMIQAEQEVHNTIFWSTF